MPKYFLIKYGQSCGTVYYFKKNKNSRPFKYTVKVRKINNIDGYTTFTKQSNSTTVNF